MARTRFDLEKFNGENDFYLWNLTMQAILIQQKLDGALNDEDEDSKAKKEKGKGFFFKMSRRPKIYRQQILQHYHLRSL